MENIIEGQISEDEAKKALLEAKQKKVSECSKEIEEVLAKHGCAIQAAMVVSPSGNQPLVQIIVKE